MLNYPVVKKIFSSGIIWKHERMIKVRKFYDFKKWLKIRLFKMDEFPFD